MPEFILLVFRFLQFGFDWMGWSVCPRSSTKKVWLIITPFLSTVAAINVDSGMAQSNTDSDIPDHRSCHDGPYVWLKDSGLEILTVSPDDKRPRVRRSSRKTNAADRISLEVVVGQPSPTRFEVFLRSDHSVPKTLWDMPERMVVTSDLEGNFDVLTRILRSQGVVDESLNWCFGEGHLVILGDTVDRGNYVPQCLWLIYQLEAEASEAGGAVHMILGNHEAMNLAGDDRYLAPKYEWLIQKTGLKLDELYSADSELGRWLRTRNAVEKIGDRLFVHAGISPRLLEKKWTIERINQTVRENLGGSKFEGEAELIMKSAGPLWYRGLVEKDDGEPKAKKKHVHGVLKHFGVNQIVVGHTVVDTISTDFDGGVLRVDLKHPKTRQDGMARALRIESGQCYVVGDDGSQQPIR